MPPASTAEQGEWGGSLQQPHKVGMGPLSRLRASSQHICLQRPLTPCGVRQNLEVLSWNPQDDRLPLGLQAPDSLNLSDECGDL